VLERSLTVDALKVIAAQFIVWHHFSAYGPMADTMTLMWPQLMEWLYRYARLAVQVFLVVGGYLAAQSVMHQSLGAVLCVGLGAHQHCSGRLTRHHPRQLVAQRALCVAIFGTQFFGA
jgi:hypothetical protein